MKLDSRQVAGFVSSLLLPRYDNPVQIPRFHKELWDICTSGDKRIAIAAPRSHAKSTAITHTLGLAFCLFRIKKYVLVVSDTESQASQFLGDIKIELLENSALRDLFGIRKLIKDSVTDLVVEMDDGYRFRLQALGAEQKVRGRKWGNTRPDLILVDDLENDEMVESDDRRDKAKSWFLKALVPSLSKTGHIIVVGTILHMDSILMSLINNKSWTTKLYRAHRDFDDFSELLWPEQWPESELRKIRQEYIDAGYSEGYSSEYLNDPIANTEAYFRKVDFLPIEEEMRNLPTNNYAALDLAISDSDKAAYTVITVGGMDQYRRLLLKRVIRFRGDANEIINTMIAVQQQYDIQLWKVEEGQIKSTLMGPLIEKMNETGIYLNISGGNPGKDKRGRARGIQARMRAGGVYFDKEAPWYPAFEQELLQFPKGMYKDQVDSFAWLGIAINELSEGPSIREYIEEDYIDTYEDSMRVGASPVTGY